MPLESELSALLPESAIDWKYAREFLLAAVAHRLRGQAGDFLEDIAHEALAVLIRVSRRESIENLDGFLNRLANFAVSNHFRRTRVWDLYVESLEGSSLEVADLRPAPELGDPEERLVFVAQEFFEGAPGPCRDIAHEVIGRAKRTWREIGALLGRSETTVRKQWSRCLERLRKAGGGDADLLMAWTLIRG